MNKVKSSKKSPDKLLIFFLFFFLQNSNLCKDNIKIYRLLQMPKYEKNSGYTLSFSLKIL